MREGLKRGLRGVGRGAGGLARRMKAHKPVVVQPKARNYHGGASGGHGAGRGKTSSWKWIVAGAGVLAAGAAAAACRDEESSFLPIVHAGGFPKFPINKSLLRTEVERGSWICIRVWSPHDAQGRECSSLDALLTKGSVGHISVESSNGTYASFWPLLPQDGGEQITFPGKAGTVTPRQHTYALDIQYEKREPEYTYYLYSLDTELFEQEYARFQAEAPGYSLKSANILNLYSGENCSGLAYRLLKSAGFGELTSSCENLKLTVTPDQILQGAREAKAKEYERFPETVDWDRHDLDGPSGSSCVIS